MKKYILFCLIVLLLFYFVEFERIRRGWFLLCVSFFLFVELSDIEWINRRKRISGCMGGRWGKYYFDVCLMKVVIIMKESLRNLVS